MINFYTPLYASLKSTFKYYIRRKFKVCYKDLKKHEDEIALLASFLFISSSFMSKTETTHQYYDFKWQSYFTIYKSGTLNKFVVCAIRYLLDVSSEMENTPKISEDIPNLAPNFTSQYQETFMTTSDECIDVKTQLRLLELVLKVYRLYKYQIPQEPGKVVELVKYLTIWKSIVLELFRYKAEYALFSFLINLRK